MSRDAAKRHGLVYYDNGVPCKDGHSPVVRLASTGACYYCVEERKAERAEEVAKQKLYKPLYYLNFKMKDGTFVIVGPFRSTASAARAYRRKYLEEYGVECPKHYLQDL